MKVVLDANVLIAALIARGVCHELLEHCVVRHTLITADPILDDVQDHLVDKFKYTQEQATEARQLFASQMTSVVPHSLDYSVCRDPDDDLVLGAALAASVDFIVTGDKDLLVLREYADIKIVSPSQFLALEAQSG
jgi:putative PIN family toxin of toxin-antitoxin system